jgi:murein DD-endopeptidase MepM/ murein hydrolase activator NlpD
MHFFQWQRLPVFAALMLAFSYAAAFELQGELTQGGLIVGRTAPDAKVFLDEQPIPVADNGVFVFGFDRDAPPAAQLKVITGKSTEQRALAITRRQYVIQRVEGVPQKTVTPPPEETARIKREAELVAKARAITGKRTDFLHFEWPLIGPVSGVFGSQRFYNGEARRPHYGVDVAAAVGTPVKAPAPGVVTLAEPDLFFSGGTLIIDHGYGVSSTMMHLSAVLVRVGDEIKTGDVIGKVGRTGRATGPHLDWRINWRDRRLDAALVVPPMPSGAKIKHNPPSDFRLRDKPATQP